MKMKITIPLLSEAINVSSKTVADWNSMIINTANNFQFDPYFSEWESVDIFDVLKPIEDFLYKKFGKASIIGKDILKKALEKKFADDEKISNFLSLMFLLYQFDEPNNK